MNTHPLRLARRSSFSEEDETLVFDEAATTVDVQDQEKYPTPPTIEGARKALSNRDVAPPINMPKIKVRSGRRGGGREERSEEAPRIPRAEE